MPQIPKSPTVVQREDYVRILYRDPDRFETIGTPDWAEMASDSVVEGSEVRMGKRTDGGAWEPHAVLVPRPTDEDEARRVADEILQRIEY